MTTNSNKTATMTKITIVGSVNMDLVFRTPRMPAPGETLSGHQFLQVPGGKGGNQAVAAARQGAQVRLLARVGGDGLGQQLRTSLEADGVDTTDLLALPGMASGVAGIFVDDAGQNSIVVAPGANAALTQADVAAAAESIQSAQFLICQLESPLASVASAIALAHKAGVTVVFNPTPVQALSDALLAQVDYLVVNEIEAAQLSGVAVHDEASARQAAQILLGRGTKTVLLTMGAQGVLSASTSASTSTSGDGLRVALHPAFSVPVADTTAAGDTFVGTFVACLGAGLALVDACRQAQAAAALCVTRLGAQSSIPHHGEVAAFLRSQTPS